MIHSVSWCRFHLFIESFKSFEYSNINALGVFGRWVWSWSIENSSNGAGTLHSRSKQSWVVPRSPGSLRQPFGPSMGRGIADRSTVICLSKLGAKISSLPEDLPKDRWKDSYPLLVQRRIERDKPLSRDIIHRSQTFTSPGGRHLPML